MWGRMKHLSPRLVLGEVCGPNRTTGGYEAAVVALVGVGDIGAGRHCCHWWVLVCEA